MAIEIRRRDGNEYYYYKVTGGESIYLGTMKNPSREGVTKALKLFRQRTDRLSQEEQILQQLLNATKAEQG